MWITVATVNENVDMELAAQQLIDSAAIREVIVAEGVETGGYLLAPHETPAAAQAAFGPGVVYKRAWDLESTARRMADFSNNHAFRQITVVVEEQPNI